MKVNPTLMRWSRNVHIYLSVMLLVMLVFFAVTGITLNHPDWVGAPQTNQLSLDLSKQEIKDQAALFKALKQHMGIDASTAELEQDDDLWLIDLQLPGESYRMEFDATTGELQAEHINYGFLAKVNDLHKGRHTNPIWKVFIDLSSVLVLLFSLSGLVLLLPNKRKFKPTMIVGALSAVAMVVIALH